MPYAVHKYEIIPCHYIGKSKKGNRVYKANSKRDKRRFTEVFETLNLFGIFMQNNMIIEDYVSFETAKLLKEKGFDAEGVSEFGGFYVDYYHTEERIGIATESGMLNKTLEDWEYLRPTLQMAMKWLREVHKLYFWIAHKMKQNKGLPWYYGIHNSETGSVVKIGDVVCGSYEVACESAIRYCLENLI